MGSMKGKNVRKGMGKEGRMTIKQTEEMLIAVNTSLFLKNFKAKK